MSGVSLTAAPPMEMNWNLVLQRVAAAYSDMNEHPLSVALIQSVSEQVHRRTLSLYKLADEK